MARRVSLDLTGLPPNPEEVAKFVADASPDAYAKWISGRMRSQAYGEHRGRYWLDAARYGDTHGLHIDNYREMWAYRDWVIRAFNRNLPFDQFTVDQLAGDLLPDPTPEQLVATGFHRCNITTNEGGVIKDEVEVMYAKDRVDTTGTVWLGLTVGCATCHDHKFDPITQKDFYSLAAFFRNTTQKPLDGNVFDPPPVMIVPAISDTLRWDQLKQEEPAARDRRDEVERAAEDEFLLWLDSDSRLDLNLDDFDDSQTFFLELGEEPHLRVGSEKRELVLSGSTRVDRSGPIPSLELPEDSFVEIQDSPGLEADRPFTVSVTFRFRKGGSRMILARQVDPDEDNRGWSIEIVGERPLLNLQVKDGRNMGVRGVEENKLAPDQWHNLIVTYDGLRQRTGMNFYLDGAVVPTQSFGRAIRVLEGSIRNSKPLVLGAGDRPSAGKYDFLNGSVRQFKILDQAVDESEARLLARWDTLAAVRKRDREELESGDREALRAYFLVRRNAAFGQAARDLKSLQDERRAILRRSSLTHVMRENPDSDPMAHILRRGMYDQRGEEVRPATPGVLPAMDPGPAAESAGVGPMAGGRRQPPHQPGHGQPLLAGGLRDRPGTDLGRFRVPGGSAHAPPAPGLAGGGVSGFGMGREASFPPDAGLGHLPAVGPGDRREDQEGSGKSPLLPGAPLSVGRGDGAGLCPGRQRPAGTPNRRTQRQDLSTGGTVGSGGHGREQHPLLQTGLGI